MGTNSGARSRHVRIALVGCGEVCEHKHLPALQRVERASVVAVVDPDAERRLRVADRYGIAHRFADVDALLDAGVCDAVGVLTPPAHHATAATAALRAGLPTLVEKPLALGLADADAVICAARDSGTPALMGLHMRWHRLVRRLRDAIAAGAVGRPHSLRAIWSSPRGDRGIPAWKRTRVTGGGALVELGVHLFDQWRFLFGTEVVEVSGLAEHGTRDDETVHVSGRLANGVLATVVVAERTAHAIEIEVGGDAGRIRVDGQRFDGWEMFATLETSGGVGPRVRQLADFGRELPRGLARMRTLGDYGDSYRGQWQHFVDCLTSGATPECSLEDGRASLRVVLAAAKAVTDGSRVPVAASPCVLTAP